MNKTDAQLKREIEEELRWDPKVNSAQIEVRADEGSVSLRGIVDTYGEKGAAADAVWRVNGVRTLVHDLSVKLLGEHIRKDSDLAIAIRNTLSWDVFVPRGLTVRVQNGAVTLGGHVDWHYQRDAAALAIRNLAGIVSVHNAIVLRGQPPVGEVRDGVLAALQRQAVTDTHSIGVHTVGGKVTLTGHAASWQSIEDAAHAAWSAPGVTDVVDQVKLQMTS
jgi:osmotically-inducible protein OsmY